MRRVTSKRNLGRCLAAFYLLGTVAQAESRECLNAQVALSSTPEMLAGATPCNVIIESFLIGNDIRYDPDWSASISKGAEYPYYIQTRTYMRHKDELDALDRSVLIVSAMALLGNATPRRRALYNMYFSVELWNADSESGPSHRKFLDLAILVNNEIGQIYDQDALICLVESDIPIVTIDEVLASNFYKACLE